MPLLRPHLATEVDSVSAYLLMYHEAAVANLLEVREERKSALYLWRHHADLYTALNLRAHYTHGHTTLMATLHCTPWLLYQSIA